MSQDQLKINSETSKKEILCYLLREFYRLEWATGSGGGISIRESNSSIWMAPSGVHKEFVQPDDLFELNIDGEVVTRPSNGKLRCSECTPLFLQAYKVRNAGAVLHSHSMNAVMITKIFGTEFHCTDLEMIKGLVDHKNTEWCRVPIIENTENECELTESLKNAILAYPRSYAVLVRNHGVYIWGPTWEKAKIHAECYDYLFKIVLKMFKHGLPIPRTCSSDYKIKSWIIDPDLHSVDLRNELQERNVRWQTEEDLKFLGIELFKLNGDVESEQLKELCLARNYKNSDIKEICQKMDKYDEMTKIFATEHLHADEEIRYVLTGSGYFDIRNKLDQWVRIQVTKGDLIILPEGIYHRYVPDLTNYIKVMRIFQEEPKWTPYNRPSDDHPSRFKYASKYT